MADPRMLVLDLDGTTLTRSLAIAERDRLAVARLQAEGIPVTIATGRLYCGTEPVARTLAIEGPVACMNGSEIVELANGQRSLQRRLGGNDLELLRATMGTHGLTCFLFSEDGIHHCDGAAPWLRFLRTWAGALHRHDDVLRAPAWESGAAVLSVAAAGPREVIREAVEACRETLGDALETILFPVGEETWYLSVRDRHEDKGTALGHLAAHYGLEAAHCVAVGDWLNDLPMFRASGRSFAMGQAHEEARAAADETLAATSETGGGIAEVAERVWGIRI